VADLDDLLCSHQAAAGHQGGEKTEFECHFHKNSKEKKFARASQIGCSCASGEDTLNLWPQM
jgi:hypothetical protein